MNTETERQVYHTLNLPKLTRGNSRGDSPFVRCAGEDGQPTYG